MTDCAERYRELLHRSPTAYRASTYNGDPRYVAVCLYDQINELTKRVMELEAIAPKAVRLPDGTLQVWRCPLDSIPVTDLTEPKCPTCAGKGWIYVAEHAYQTGPEAMEEPPRAYCPRCSKATVDYSKLDERGKFLADLQATRDMVAAWPEWKRNALGPVLRGPDFPAVKRSDV